jgi:hypothetical protein
VDITDQLKEIGVFLAEDRFIPILEEVTMSPMAAVVSDGVTGEKSSHHHGDGDRACPKQEVNVIRKQDPGIAGSGGLGQNVSQPTYKSIPILVILEDSSALDASYNDVMQSTGSVDTGLSRHRVRIAKGLWFVNLYFYGRPHFSNFLT